jgi:hypothetical protein
VHSDFELTPSCVACRGLTLEDEHGRLRRVFPVPISLLGDIQAKTAALLLNSSLKSPFPDANYLVPSEQLDAVYDNIPHPKRLETEMTEIFRKAAAIVAAADGKDSRAQKEAKDTVEELLKKASLSRLVLFDPMSPKMQKKGVQAVYEDEYLPTRSYIYGAMDDATKLQFAHFHGRRCQYPAITGFAFFDAYQGAAPDILHVVNKGITDYIINPEEPTSLMHAVLAQVDNAGAILRDINAYISNLPRHLKINLPAEGLCQKSMTVTSNQNASLLAVIGPALLRHDCFKPLLPCIKGQ